MEIIVANREVRIQTIVELCSRVLSGCGMLAEWVLSVLVPIVKRKGDIVRNGRAVKLLA